MPCGLLTSAPTTISLALHRELNGWAFLLLLQNRSKQKWNSCHWTVRGINNPMPKKTTRQRSAKDTEWWHSWGGRTTWWALPHQQPELHIILQRLRGEIVVLLLTAKVFIFLNKLNIIEITTLFPLQIDLDQTPLYLPWFQAISAAKVLALLS